MTETRKLRAQDLQFLIDQKGRSYVRRITDEQAASLEAMPYAVSVFVEGELQLCTGVNVYWPNRGEAWAVFHPHCRKNFIALHHAVKRHLETVPLRRIEAGVDVDFAPGHRWMRALGFELEAPRLRAFLPDGRDASLYSKIRREVTHG